MTKRRFVVAVAALVLLPATAVSMVARFAYVRAPRLVARLDEAGAMPLSPSERAERRQER